MRHIKPYKGGLILMGAVLIGLCPRLVYSASPTVDTQSTSGSTVITSEEIQQTEVGTGIFSRLPFHASVSVRGGYDDNVFTSEVFKQESWFTNVSGMGSYEFGDARTKLSLGVGAGATFYFDRPGDDVDPNVYLNLAVTHKASARLTLAAQAYLTYQAEPDFSLTLGLNRRSGNFFYTQDKFTATYLWAPRFATATSYTVGAIRYDDNGTAFFEDRIENTIGNEFRYLLWPSTTVVAEYRFQVITYDDIDRDSGTHFFLAGFDHTFNPRFNASFRGGVEYRDYCNNDLGNDQTAPYFEAALNYALGKETTVAWVNRYAIEEPDVLLNPSRTTFRTGLTAKHNFTPRISASLGAFYQHDAYDDVNTLMVVTPGFDEDSFDVAVTFRYAVTRIFGVEAGYNHTEVMSDAMFRSYSRNRVFAGLNLAF